MKDYYRKEENMARATETVPARTEKRDTNGLSFAPPVTLALWQLRQAWRLLLIVGTGMLAAVVLVCAIPLYTQLSMTAGLRGVLTSSSQNADIVVRSSSKRISSSIISTATRNLNAEFQKQLARRS